jgi:hypothetical protein
MHYCAYSFADLFKAAHGRQATAAENKNFNALTQPQRNQAVKALAKQANWQTEEVETKAGLFIAFWPGS